MHGIESVRDFQVGLSRAWHNLTEVVEAVTADRFPEIVASPLTYTVGEELREWPGMTVPISTDDGLPVGTASGESYTLFTPREAMAYLSEVLAGTGHKAESLGMIFDRSRWFVTYSLDELQGVAPDGEAFKLTASGGLDTMELQWDRRTALGVVLAAHGYPGAPRTGDVVRGLPAEAPDAVVFHAATARQDDAVVTSGGRVLCVTVLADNVRQAQQRAYDIVRSVQFEGRQYRQDIGHRALGP